MNRLSIRSKMMLLACTSAGVALLMTCLGVAAIGIHTLRTAKVRQLEERAKLLALYSSPIITLRDARSGEQLLASLKSDPSIISAYVFDAQKKRVADWGDGNMSSLPSELISLKNLFVASHLEVVQPVDAGEQRIGYIYLRANTDDLKAEYAKFARIALYVAAAAMVVATLMSLTLQRAISRPILALTDAARRISVDGNYSIRVSTNANGELKTLRDTFNNMLQQIQDSEHALQRAHASLEDRVTDRTQALSEEINRRKKVQDDLERARDVAESASRAKSEFLANMSHEIRTPLNGILGYTHLLLQSDDWTREELHEYLSTIHQSGRHLLDLLRDILDLSKVEAGRLEVERIECSAQAIISEVVSVMSARAQEKHLTLDFRWSANTQDTMVTDPARLRQLLINLVSNAIKFTETGGVRVIAGLDRMLSSRVLCIEVVDTGIGIPQDKLDAIFEPFTQADNSVTRKYGGTGLGLAICRKITKALGGELEVSSEVGEGSVFRVVLNAGEITPERADDRRPVAEGHDNSPAIPEEPAEEEPAPQLDGARILVVDDGETNRKLTSLILRRAGAVTTTAENGLEAVQTATSQEFDLILMDMQMPVMDGYSATSELRAQGYQLPIIALTAHAMKGDEDKCRAAGCTGYLTKPVDEPQLRSVAAKMMAGNSPARRTKLADFEIAVPRDTADAPPPVAPDRPALRPRPNFPDAFADEPIAPLVAPRPIPERPTPPAIEAAPPQPAAQDIMSTLPLDDPEIYEIVAEFVERLGERLVEMKQLIAARDDQALAKLGHWLKGVGGTAGFPMLTAPAKEFEQMAKEGQFEEAAAKLAEIEQLAARIAMPEAPVAI